MLSSGTRLSQFRNFLKRRHGTVDDLKRCWGLGYDRSDPTYRGDIPFYEYKPGVFDHIGSFDDVPLPPVERKRNVGKPGSPGGLAYWLNVPLDPMFWTM